MTNRYLVQIILVITAVHGFLPIAIAEDAPFPPAPPPHVVSRADWDAKPPTRILPPHTIERITVHHQGVFAPKTQDAKRRLRTMQAFHQGPKRNFADIAYHFIIDRKGIVYEGRSLSVPGETKTDYDPKGHLLICLLGDLNVQQPTPEQLKSLLELIDWALETYHLSKDMVKTHRDYAHTDCPGKHLNIDSLFQH